MRSQRWGTFSVVDHKDAAAMAPEVLLYDKLVLPYPSSDEERQRWDAAGRDTSLLDRRLSELGPLAVKALWDSDRNKKFDVWMEELERVDQDLAQMTKEAKEKMAYAMTRRILAQDTALPQAGTRIVRVAAYQSEADLRSHFILESNPRAREAETLGYLLAHRIAVPANLDPGKALAKAIEMATKNDDFLEHRAQLYDWQDSIVSQNIPPKQAAGEMDQMIRKYNESVTNAVKDVYFKFACTLSVAALGILGSGFNPVAVGGALVALVSFARFDRTPVPKAGLNAPAAMFHDAEACFQRFRWA